MTDKTRHLRDAILATYEDRSSIDKLREAIAIAANQAESEEATEHDILRLACLNDRLRELEAT